MYERHREPLAPLHVYYKRMARNVLFAGGILLVCLLIGIAGYHYTADIEWLDALHNASMILSGMGPVVEIKTVSGKWFSSFYALFSGVVFITNIGVVLAPALHRMLHRFHLQEK